MKKNNYKLKTLLTTSALALAFASNVGSAYAAARTTHDNDAVLATGVDLTWPVAQDEPLDSGDSLTLNGVHNFSTGNLQNVAQQAPNPASFVLTALDIANHGGATFTLDSNNDLRFVIQDLTGQNGRSIKFAWNNANNLKNTLEINYANANAEMHIGASTVADKQELVLNVHGNQALHGTITPGGADSRLSIVNTHAAVNSTLTLYQSIAGATSGHGIIELNAQSAELEITKQGGQTLGTQANKLGGLIIKSGKDAANKNEPFPVIVSADVYSKNTVLQDNPSFRINSAVFNSPITTSADKTGRLQITAAAADLGAIGTKTDKLESVTLAHNRNYTTNIFAYTVTNNDNIISTLSHLEGEELILDGANSIVNFTDNANITAHIKGEGVVNFGKDVKFQHTKIGEDKTSLAAVNFTRDFNKPDLMINADRITHVAGKNVTIGGVFGGPTALGANTNLNFEENAIIASNITGNASNNITFINGSTISKTMGTAPVAAAGGAAAVAAAPLGTVTFQKGTNLNTIEANINATNIAFNEGSSYKIQDNVEFRGAVDAQGNVVFGNNIKFHNPITVEHAELDVGSNRVHLDAAGNIIRGNNAIHTEVDAANNFRTGQLVLNAPATLDVTGINTLNIVLNTINLDGYKNGAEVYFNPTSLIVGNNLPVLDITRVNVMEGDGKVAWNFDHTQNKYIGIYNKPNSAFSEFVAEAGKNNPNAKELFASDSPAAREFLLLSDKDKKTASEATERALNKNDTEELIEGAIDVAIRLLNIKNRDTTSTDKAAGDAPESLRYGAWAMASYNLGNQKQAGNLNGYKSKIMTATLGVDTKANETLSVGIAATYADTKAKHQNKLAGNSSKISTYMLSLYANQTLFDNFFVAGIANFGTSKINNKELRIGFVNNEVTKEHATGKYDAMNWGVQVTGGYNHKLNDQFTLIPSFGAAYSELIEAGYQESGTRNQNRTVSKKLSRKLDLIAGLKVESAVNYDGVTYIPEVHGYVSQAVLNKAPKSEIKLENMAQALEIKSKKSSGTSGNVGTSLAIKSGMLDYSLGYDLSIAKKYMGHQGTLKVRVSF